VNTFNVPDILEGDDGADTYVRHKSNFASDDIDIDIIVGFNSAQGDRTKDITHLYN
jgi:hypothetical protein